MHAQSISDQKLIEEIHQLPPEKVSEVLDFVEFLAQKHREQGERQLTHTATQLSQGAFAAVWNNPDDAVYDNL